MNNVTGTLVPTTIDASTDPRSFRDALGKYPTGVALVTTIGADGPVGLAVNSFASVSLDPPLVSFCAMRTSESWAQVRAAGGFTVSVLGSEHEWVARRFTQRGVDRFADATWQSAPSGRPVLADALSWFDTEIVSITDAGDHELVLARVTACARVDSGEPLVFFGGGYGRLAS